MRRPAVALQTEKRRGGCAYESLAERKTKDAAQRSNTQFEGYVPAAWNSGFSGPDGACCLPALGRLGNRKLADKYIADTAKLYVDQINRDMSQINSELIYLLDSDSNIKEIPD